MNIWRRARGKRGVTQVEVADALGVPASTISRLERGLHHPRVELEQKLMAYYGLSPEEIEEDRRTESDESKNSGPAENASAKPEADPRDLSTIENALIASYRSGIVAARQIGTPAAEPEVAKIPLLGEAAAGYGYSAEMDTTGETLTVPLDMLRDAPGTYFALRVHGESMAPDILDGDTAVIHQQPTVADGEIGLVVYGDDLASVGSYGTLKRVRMEPGRITLIPINPEYETIILADEDLRSARIQGRLDHIIRAY